MTPPSEPRTEVEGRPPWTARDAGSWLLLAVVGLAAGQLFGELCETAMAAALGHSRQLSALQHQTVPPAWLVVSGLVGLWAGFIGAVVLASRLRGTGRFWRDMGLRFRPVDFLLGPLVGFGGQYLLLPLLYLPLRPVIPHLQQRLSQPAKQLTGGFHGPDLAVAGVLTVLIVPFVEELFFRGLLLQSLARLAGRLGSRLGPTVAVVVTGILFGLAHFEAVQLFGLAVFGALLALLAYRTRRLGPSIVAHACFNLAAVLSLAVVPGMR